MRKPLNRDRIATAALELVDREGLDALSMRKLGKALGVQAMSLYRYFDSKDALLDGIQSIADNSFITFSWTDDGTGALTCTRIGSSTQSFYLPKIKSNL